VQISVVGTGIFLAAGGFALLGYSRRYPEEHRRGRRRVNYLERKARKAGLRGNYRFSSDSSKWMSITEFGTYVPADADDRVLYEAVGSRIEGDSEFFAREMLWTGPRLAWVAIPGIVLGCALTLMGTVS
jgi:hypothetical protein